MPTSATRSFRLGTHLVEPDLNVVHGPHGDVQVDPKAMELLVHLVERPGQFVTREHLIQQVWCGTPEGDASLTTAVSQLRQALADDRGKPRFIETRPGQGYRLLVASAPVERRAARSSKEIGNAVAGLARIFRVSANPAVVRASRLRPRLIGFLSSLRKRKIVQWTFAYLAAAWAALQALDLVADSYAWPQMVMRLSFELAALGFMVMLVLAWYHGERGAQRVSSSELLIVTLLLGLGGVLVFRSGVQTSSVSGGALSAAAVARPVGGQESTPANGMHKVVVAVLPFRNLSGQKDRDFLGEGLADALIARLGRLADISVIARSSAFASAVGNPEVAVTAKRLGAGVVISGELTRIEPHLQVRMRFFDAAGREMFASEHDTQAGGILAMPDQLARQVVDRLRSHSGVETPQFAGFVQETRDVEAYKAYLQARHYMGEGGESALHHCAVLYLKAIALDPGFAQAYQGLAVIYRRMAEQAPDPARRVELENLSLLMASRALDRDASLGEAYVIYADGEGDRVLTRYHQWETLSAVFAHAINLEPDNPTLRLWHAASLRNMGYVTEAAWEAAIASRLDPLNPRVNHELGWVYYLTGRVESARQHALYRAEDSHGRYLIAARLAVEQRDFAAARAILDRSAAPDRPERRWMRRLLTALEEPDKKAGLLDELEAAVAVRPAGIDLFTAFVIYAYLEESERALSVLGQALEPAYAGAPDYYQMWTPAFAGLRQTATFRALMERVGLAEFWRNHGWPDDCKPQREEVLCF